MNYVDPSRLLVLRMRAEASVVTQLLAVRVGMAGVGNRRALYSRMDALFGEEVAASGGEIWSPSPPPGREAGAVRLTRMRLRNWKAFERADIVFPIGKDGQSIVVIEGANGFGKSSILEAYAFGLFGTRVLSEAGFLISGAARASGQRRSYRTLIEKSLHRSERAHDDGVSVVTLEFETGTGPLSIERKWYFDEKGSFIEDDEELLVRSGLDLHPLSVPGGTDAKNWYQAEIERRILPVELAPFFLFDGEQVERWSERKLSDQVHFALTRLLGLGELGALSSDLRDYARDRERGLGEVDQSVVDSLQAEIDMHKVALRRDVEVQYKLNIELQRLRLERNAILTAFRGLGGVSHADLQGLLEGRHRLMADYRHAQRDLMATICDEGPIIFAGSKLLERTSAAIRAEAERQSLALLPDEIESLWRRLVSLDPPLSVDEADGLRSRLHRASLAVNQDPGAGAHGHLDRKARRMVIDRLDAATKYGLDRVREADLAVKAVAGQLAAAADAVSRQEDNHSRAADMQAELGKIAAAIESAEQDLRPLQVRVDGHEAALVALGEEVSRLHDAVSGAQPRLRASVRARQLAAAIDHHIERITDPEHQRFAQAVSASFRSLAHKDQIQRIEIFGSGEVRLIDRQNRDLTDYRLSAGESQLFAMALIGAVGMLLGDRLPLVVDTPLGRLDTQHRQSVLDMLARRKAQTILLTQPEELTLDHFDRIRPFVAAIVNLQHAADAATGVGVSTVTADQEALQ